MFLFNPFSTAGISLLPWLPKYFGLPPQSICTSVSAISWHRAHELPCAMLPHFVLLHWGDGQRVNSHKPVLKSWFMGSPVGAWAVLKRRAGRMKMWITAAQCPSSHFVSHEASWYNDFYLVLFSCESGDRMSAQTAPQSELWQQFLYIYSKARGCFHLMPLFV